LSNAERAKQNFCVRTIDPRLEPVISAHMKVEFVGVGEAFDETLPNNSQILQWGDVRLLIDCGYSVPHALWKRHPEPEYLDAIYITHRHADHYFGLPSILVRLAEDERKKPLPVFCAEATRETLIEMIDYAYQSILPKIPFEVRFEEVTAGHTHEFHGAKFDFAVTSHPVKNYAIRVSADGKQYAYSGDGNFNSHTRRLYNSCSLLVHDAYSFQSSVSGHADIAELIRMAEEEKVQRLALTHIQRETRRNRLNEIRQFANSFALDVIIPEPGDVLEI
jgi:ribonuclease BN (tRNA processing enzyme)